MYRERDALRTLDLEREREFNTHAKEKILIGAAKKFFFFQVSLLR